MSPHGCVHGVSKEVHPTSGESPIESFKTSANRTPRHGYLPPETRCKPIHGALGRRHPCRLTVPGGRYPYGPGQPLDRFAVSPPPGLVSVDSCRNCPHARSCLSTNPNPYEYRIAITSIRVRHSGSSTSVLSPMVLPSNALATGESMEMKPLVASVSSTPTMR